MTQNTSVVSRRSVACVHARMCLHGSQASWNLSDSLLSRSLPRSLHPSPQCWRPRGRRHTNGSVPPTSSPAHDKTASYTLRGEKGEFSHENQETSTCLSYYADIFLCVLNWQHAARSCRRFRSRNEIGRNLERFGVLPWSDYRDSAFSTNMCAVVTSKQEAGESNHGDEEKRKPTVSVGLNKRRRN